MNSIRVTNSWMARKKKLITTTSQARNSTRMLSRLPKTLGKPLRLLICSSNGLPASMPMDASRPGCRNSAWLSAEPDASRPSPANERKTISASTLKLPIMKAKAPT
ncbi:hypothetical protein D9M68_873390 [compost metagenome]